MSKSADLSAESRLRVANLVRDGACVRRAATLTGLPVFAVLRYVESQADLIAQARRNGAIPVPPVPFAGTPEDRAVVLEARKQPVSAESCAALWCALLAQQVQLARGVGARTYAGRNFCSQEFAMREARQWLLGPECAMVCDLVGIDVEMFQAEARLAFPDFRDVVRRVYVKSAAPHAVAAE
jgi:hypothetical protein